jgi:1,4-alpha-glucan branching enzyme
MKAPIMYEVNTRAWLRELSEKAGRLITLADVPETEIEQWVQLGFTHIWLMGVWQVGPKAREVALRYWREHWSKEGSVCAEDVQGSPYAIQEYAIDSRIGDALALLMLKERLGRLGLRLIIDFVPNHLGVDSSEPSRFPARFVHSTESMPGTFQGEARFGKRFFAHGRDPYFPPWEDTVQFDYRVTETHHAMTAVAQTASAYADGLRCDMAMLLIPEIFRETWKNFPSQGAHQTDANFWRKGISAVRQLQPQAQMIAEVYWGREEELQECGFDFTYSKRVFDHLVRGEDRELREFLHACSPSFLRRSVHFLENHDEARIASLMQLERHRAAAALILFLPGMALLHDGQLEGRKHFARIQMSKRPEEKKDVEIQHLYRELLRAVKETHVRSGRGTLLNTGGAGIAVLWQGPETESDVALVNLAREEATIQFEPGILANLALEKGTVLYQSKPHPPGITKGTVILPGESAYILRLRTSET